MMKMNIKSIILVVVFTRTNSTLFSQNIVEIYTMAGCGRCAYAISYAKENNLNYKEYSTENKKYNSKMWSLVQNSGKFKGGSITMPVIVNQGSVSFNINDLTGFMSKIDVKKSSTVKNITSNTLSEGGQSDQIKGILEAHNKYRAAVNIDSLKWSDELASYAKVWGEHLVENGCNLEHRPYQGKWAQKYGENLYWTSGSKPGFSEAADSWGEEKSDYDGGVMNNKKFAAGHYTQMIWAKTTHVGCATVKCKDGAYIVVCNYNPPGNYMGESPLKK